MIVVGRPLRPPEPMSSLPPALAVGALYDNLLQSALRQFFDRAVLDV